MELIPAIDIIDGKCVRLAKGDFSKKIIYNDNPVEVAKRFEGAGLKRLHIVDLDGAGGSPLKNLDTLKKISANTSLEIDFGGGLKTKENLQDVFLAGAAMVSVGSITIKDRELFAKWVVDFSPAKFLPGADVLDKKIKINGWKDDTGIDIFDFIAGLLDLNIQKIFCTDISKDGMMQGPATGLYEKILSQFPKLHLIASGGISCYEDLFALQEVGCKGAIIGKAFYEGKITIDQIDHFIKNN